MNSEENPILEPVPEGPAPEPNPNQRTPFARTVKRLWNRFKQFIVQPSNIILVFFAAFLTLFVIYPLFKLALASLSVNGSFEADLINDEWNASVKNGDFTFLQWPTILFPNSTDMKFYSENMFWNPLWKSILMALMACGIAVVSGGVIAYLITRSNLPFKKFISTVFIFPYIMPSWSIAMFWENFFKNSKLGAAAGIGMLESLTGICVPQALCYGIFPTAICLGIHYAPFAYILIGGILRNMDANLEEAAVILKASRWKITRRITLPIVAPAMVSTILLVFSSSLSTFTVPQKLQFKEAISVSIRGAFSTVGFHGFGYVMAVVLLFFSVLILTINNWFTKSRRNFTTVSGKSGQASKVNLRAAKWPIFVIVAILVTFFAIVPLISFILESLEEVSGKLNTITLDYWISEREFDTYISTKSMSTQGVFHNYTIWQSFGRSIITATLVSLLAGTFGILIGYAVAKNRRGKLSNFVSSLAFLPYLIPSLSFCAVFYALVKTPALSFLDVMTTQSEVSAIAICVIIGMVKFMPFASKTGTNAMLQVSGEIEEAAIINGCPWFKRMTRILFPIQKASFISGYLLPFISCMREYTLFILVTSNITLITNTLAYFQTNSLNQLANAMNLLIVLFVIIANFLVNALTGASIDKGIGG